MHREMLCCPSDDDEDIITHLYASHVVHLNFFSNLRNAFVIGFEISPKEGVSTVKIEESKNHLHFTVCLLMFKSLIFEVLQGSCAIEPCETICPRNLTEVTPN